MMPLGIITGPIPGGHKLEPKNKDVELMSGENDSGERSRAIMALLFFVTLTQYGFILTLRVSLNIMTEK